MAEIRDGYVSLVNTGSLLPLVPSSFKDLETGGAGAAESESGWSGRTHDRDHHHPAGGGRGRRSYRTLGSSSPPSAGAVGRFLCDGEGHHHHFLDACSLCKKPLGGHRDIFMYRGDMPFCSEECRQEQIDIDADKEKNWTKLPMKAAASREEPKPNAARPIHIRVAGTIVAG